MGRQNLDVVAVAIIHQPHRQAVHHHIQPLGAGAEHHGPQELLRAIQLLLLQAIVEDSTSAFLNQHLPPSSTSAF